MDHIEMSGDQVVPIDDIADGVRGLRIVFVNVFGLEHANGTWTLVDAGLPLSETLIRSWAEKNYDGPPNAIVLTHGHFDHASSAASLADHWNVPIYAHPLERPYLTGVSEYPAPNFAAGGGLMSLLSPMLPRKPIDLSGRLRDFGSNDDIISIAELPGWRLLHTPGHTPGHTSLFREQDLVLLAGDAFCTTKPESFFASSITQTPELHGPPSYFTSDWKSARESVHSLARLEPRTVAPGHGQPITGPQVPEELARLFSRFDEVAIPDNQRDAA